MGLGPDSDDPVAWDGNVGSVPASLSLMPNLAAHVLSRSVRAIAVFPPHVVLGGSFLGHLTNRLDYLVRWDGAKVEGIGGGLDGTVYALETVRNFLVVAGSFSQLYQDDAVVSVQTPKTVKSGGLGKWDGERWSLVGGAAVNGVVTCMAVASLNEPGFEAQQLLYVAGRFRQVGDVPALNIAAYNFVTQRWRTLSQGLRARDVYALAVSPRLNSSHHSLFAVGSISHAGALDLGNVGMWRSESETWHPMRNVNGVVRAAAVMDGRLFIGGDFTAAGGEAIAAIAYTNIHEPGMDISGNTCTLDAIAGCANSSFVWRRVGVGVQGNVHVLRAVTGCMYVGGRFDSVGDHEGIKSANNIARWCTLPSESPFHTEKWEPVQGLDNAGGTVLAIVGADPQLGNE